MSDPGYLRHPAIHGDTVYFICDDDLWSIAVAGGIARRLTANIGEAAFPAVSPCGNWLAFIGRDEMHPEVHLIPAEGGEVRRLTWLASNKARVRGWTPDGRIILSSTAGQAFFRFFRAFLVDPAGGEPEILPHGLVCDLAYGPNGAMVIGRDSDDPAIWKRYRGGQAGHLWVDAGGSGEFRRMSELAGNIACPMWLGERIYFLADHEGIGNLYSCLADSSDLQRHTDHADFYARHASSDGRRIVYQCGADIYCYDPASATSTRLDIRVPAARAQASRRFVDAAEFLGGFCVHPKGHSLAIETRGKLFSFPLWEQAVTQHGAPDGVRYRCVQWMADGETLVAVSDATGEERIELRHGGETRSIDLDVGRVLALYPAPQGPLLALCNHRHELWLLDTAAGSGRLLDTSEYQRIEHVAWSPDAAWLAYEFAVSARSVSIKLRELASARTAMVTGPEFKDYAPVFDPAGQYLYFLSYRTFDPVYDSLFFDMNFPRGAKPYLVALQADAQAPFQSQPRGLGEDDKHDEKADEQDDAAGEKPVRIDLDGIAERIAAFPVKEARYAQLAAIEGKVLWSLFPIPAAIGEGGHGEDAGQGELEAFDFDTMQAELIVDSLDHFVVSADGTTLVYETEGRLRAVRAGEEIDEEQDDDDKPGRKSGWIDLERVRVAVSPKLEWAQMLREIWRLQRDQFWVADMSGVDWQAVYQRYQPLLARVATRGEFSDLVWELQGELGTSHCYESGGDYREPPALAVAQLAADLDWDDSAACYRLRHIVRGDAWRQHAGSPLADIGARLQVGDRLLAVNGLALDRHTPPGARLVNQAGQLVSLRVAAPDGTRVREVVVHTLKTDVPARYREWVENNRAWVHAQSGGRVGYLHIPDMMGVGFAEFHRYFNTESEREALIVDVRFNRGGHVSPLLLEKLARRRIGYDLSRWGKPVPYPYDAPAGPVVALTNAHAGSDGDMFSHAFKLMKIGPLVGTRTWGGVIGIWPRHDLVDGSETSQPEFSMWFGDIGFGVENQGTVPDLEVDIAPQDYARGHDPQLAAALQLANERLAAEPGLKPDFGARPDLRAPGLPPRP